MASAWNTCGEWYSSVSRWLLAALAMGVSSGTEGDAIWRARCVIFCASGLVPGRSAMRASGTNARRVVSSIVRHASSSALRCVSSGTMLDASEVATD